MPYLMFAKLTNGHTFPFLGPYPNIMDITSHPFNSHPHGYKLLFSY